MIINEKHFQQFVKGNEKSFESIFCQYYKTLVSYAMRHDLELMEAEDIVLEIFHHIWQIREPPLFTPYFSLPRKIVR